MDDAITIDMDDLTLTDLMDLERELGRKTGDMLSRGIAGVDAQTLAGLVWLARRKVDPGFTIEQALNTKFNAIQQAKPSPLAAPTD